MIDLELLQLGSPEAFAQNNCCRTLRKLVFPVVCMQHVFTVINDTGKQFIYL